MPHINSSRISLRPPLVLFAVFLVLLGGLYPLSLLPFGGGAVAISSENHNGDARYFWGRPSAASGNISSASNAGPMHAPWLADVAKRTAEMQAAHGVDVPVPVELVTASASGFDPHISPEAARYQAPRVAKARGLELGKVLEIIENQMENPLFGIIGQPRVNVAALNAALSAAQ